MCGENLIKTRFKIMGNNEDTTRQESGPTLDEDKKDAERKLTKLTRSNLIECADAHQEHQHATLNGSSHAAVNVAMGQLRHETMPMPRNYRLHVKSSASIASSYPPNRLSMQPLGAFARAEPHDALRIGHRAHKAEDIDFNRQRYVR